MVLATHIIFTAYGFWLPNDPRGSWSDFVGAWELVLAGGPATGIKSRRSVAHAPHDIQARLRAKQTLQFRPVVFDGHQALHIARGFQKAINTNGYEVYACSILPTHVHAVVRRHAVESRRIIGHWKREASLALFHAQRHPFQSLTRPGGQPVCCWAEKGRSVFLDDPTAVHHAIRYVENNPVKEGKKHQYWPFVVPYAGAW